MSGSVYNGDFTNGEMTGVGRMIYSNNFVYEGDFVNGNGHGLMIYPSGNIYEGGFVNGVENHHLMIRYT